MLRSKKETQMRVLGLENKQRLNDLNKKAKELFGEHANVICYNINTETPIFFTIVNRDFNKKNIKDNDIINVNMEATYEQLNFTFNVIDKIKSLDLLKNK